MLVASYHEMVSVKQLVQQLYKAGFEKVVSYVQNKTRYTMKHPCGLVVELVTDYSDTCEADAFVKWGNRKDNRS